MISDVAGDYQQQEQRRLAALASCGNTRFIHKTPLKSSIWCRCQNSLRMRKKSGFLTRPAPAVTSPTRPESAETASSSKDASFRGQGRSERKRRGGTDRTSCGPFALTMDLDERIRPYSASDIRRSYSTVRTFTRRERRPGKGASRRAGVGAGETKGFFSIPLGFQPMFRTRL